MLVVGAGGIADAWLPPILAEKLQVCGVVDMRLDAARARIEKYNLNAPVFADVADALAVTRPDFVLDLTVPDAHCAVTCAALRRGLPVMGEKPMAASLAQARRMLRAAEAAKTLYMVSQSRRWVGHHATIARAVRRGLLGPLTTLNCDFYIGAHFGGMHAALREMLAYLRTGRQPKTECHDNIKSLAMVFAAIQSARAGRRVAITV